MLSNGERIPTATLVWTAGVRPSPLLPELGLPLDERGRVIVDGTLRVEGRRDVWAHRDGRALRLPMRGDESSDATERAARATK